jgi:glycosyltransferase involved in cell wall biosynthesis
MIRIALNELGGGQWTGGITYRNNLLKSLAYFKEEAEVVMINSAGVPVHEEFKEYKQLSKAVNGKLLDKVYGGFSQKYLGIDNKLGKTIAGQNIDVVFPSTLKAAKGVGSIYWIPDFQFMHLPNMYDQSYLKNIGPKLKKYFSDADLIVVSSEDARKDLQVFSPDFLNKVKVLRFVAHVPETLYEENVQDTRNTYHLPEDFFYLPNQFWAHKNHQLVVEALALLRRKKVNPFVVCSGNPTDVRNPMFFADFLRKLSESGVRNQFAFLGMLPHKHVYSLIRGSKCVINPSLFEGWSTSVEECKSVGKGMILSDLPVHKEQNPADSVFFDRYSAKDLAEKMEWAWLHKPAAPNLQLETEARAMLPMRMQEFGRGFIDACNEVSKN